MNDLNAVQQAEKKVFGARPGYYDRLFITNLCEVLGMNADTGTHDKRSIFEILHATSAQRAEAFLRTIGKWREA